MFGKQKKIRESFGTDAVKGILQSRLTDDGRNIKRFTSKEKVPRGFYFKSLTAGVNPVGEVSYNGEDFVFRIHNGKVYVMPSSKAGWNWSETIYKMEEGFEVGKANMETPDYEIKINGQVPIDYATAINGRQKRIDKIEKDFEEKDKLTDEFIDDNHDRFEERDKMKLKESAETNLYKRADKIANDIEEIINDISKINWEDFMTQGDFDTLNRAIEALQGFATAYFYVMNNKDVFESAEADKIRKEYQALAAKLETEGKDLAKEKLEGPLHDLAMQYVDAMMGVKESTINVDEEDIEQDNLKESEKDEEEVPAVKRGRGRPKADPKDKMYSSDDLWLQVYDDLSSEVDNEGKGKEVDKQVKIPRGKRFSGPYAGPGDYDLTVYGKTMEDLQWAKKVADHYGVDIEIKKDDNKDTNSYYPYIAILRDIK